MGHLSSDMATFLLFALVGLSCVELSTCLVVKGSVTCLDCTHHVSGSFLLSSSLLLSLELDSL